jgi:hypothetical protein
MQFKESNVRMGANVVVVAVALSAVGVECSLLDKYFKKYTKLKCDLDKMADQEKSKTSQQSR